MSKDKEGFPSLTKLPDGTIKQRNQLTGTEVWTVPGRGNRPLGHGSVDPHPLTPAQHSAACAFCRDRYLETPPEKERILVSSLPTTGSPSLEVDAEGSASAPTVAPAVPVAPPIDFKGVQIHAGFSAEHLSSATAAFRRVPNLFEIVSYNYWHLNYGYEPRRHQRERMATYLSQPAGYDHVVRVMKHKLASHGVSEAKIDALSDTEILCQAYSFFCGGHDLIIPERHFVSGATCSDQLASAGTLTPEEHYAYTAFTAHALQDLYGLNEHVRYVTAFQNWLKPAGASFDHLHKQLVAIDELPISILQESENTRRNPGVYDDILKVRVTRGLVIAQNEHAIAMAGVGHRYPTVAIWPLHARQSPWEASEEELRGFSEVLHAAHAATGPEVPCNEEWYYRPPSLSTPLRWRALIKWRVSTLAGFEGGTRIYLNTIDPWQVRERIVSRLLELREQGLFPSLRIGDETRVSPRDLS